MQCRFNKLVLLKWLKVFSTITIGSCKLRDYHWYLQEYRRRLRAPDGGMRAVVGRTLK